MVLGKTLKHLRFSIPNCEIWRIKLLSFSPGCQEMQFVQFVKHFEDGKYYHFYCLIITGLKFKRVPRLPVNTAFHNLAAFSYYHRTRSLHWLLTTSLPAEEQEITSPVGPMIFPPDTLYIILLQILLHHWHLMRWNKSRWTKAISTIWTPLNLMPFENPLLNQMLCLICKLLRVTVLDILVIPVMPEITIEHQTMQLEPVTWFLETSSLTVGISIKKWKRGLIIGR